MYLFASYFVPVKSKNILLKNLKIWSLLMEAAKKLQRLYKVTSMLVKLQQIRC